MRTNFLKSALLAVSVLCASASAETIHASIPFEFSANGTAMPAGNYTIRTVPESSSSVLLFVNDATKAQALAFVRTTHDAPVKTPLAFFIKTETKTYEIGMLPTSSPMKGALLSLSK